MAIEPGPHDLDKMRFIFGPAGQGVVKEASPTFYEELDQEFPDFRGHLLIQRFTFDEPWPTWEVHPEGDEFVYLLEGDTEFILRREGVSSSVRLNEPGSYVVVPQGAWHTARPYTTTTMLFVTPGEGTLNKVEPPDG